MADVLPKVGVAMRDSDEPNAELQWLIVCSCFVFLVIWLCWPLID